MRTTPSAGLLPLFVTATTLPRTDKVRRTNEADIVENSVFAFETVNVVGENGAPSRAVLRMPETL
jgi:hypothetical protein